LARNSASYLKNKYRHGIGKPWKLIPAIVVKPMAIIPSLITKP